MYIIPIQDIKLRFDKYDDLKDKELNRLLMLAYAGKLLCNRAIIKMQGIIPLTDFNPKISIEYRQYLEENFAEYTCPDLLVYPMGSRFILSNDFGLYHFLLEKEEKEWACIVLGSIDSPFVSLKDESFRLLLPQNFTVIN